MKIAVEKIPTILQEFSKTYIKQQFMANGMPLKDKFVSLMKIDGAILKLTNFDLQQEDFLKSITFGDMKNFDFDAWYKLLIDNIKLLGGKVPFEDFNYALTEQDLQKLYSIAQKYAITEQPATTEQSTTN